MQDNGWNVDVTHDNHDSFSQQCSEATWFGFKWDSAVGTVRATFKEQGKAILNFGNCGRNAGGLVSVNLNNKQIGSALAGKNKNEITFEYSEGDILVIKEGGNGIGIIALNSLQLLPKGRKIVLEKSFVF